MLTILTYILLLLVVILVLAFIAYKLSGSERQEQVDRWLITKCHYISTSMFGSALSYDFLGGGLDELFWLLTFIVSTLLLQVMKRVALKK